MNREDLVEKAKEIYREFPNAVYVGLYGSQNYNLDDDESDMDFRVVILPTIDDLIFGKRTSKTVTKGYGQLDVKDIMTYSEVISKGNFSFIEPFQSEYYWGSELLRDVFGSINVNYRALWGASWQKVERFKKDGDPKNIVHTLRLIDLYLECTPEKSFLVESTETKHDMMFHGETMGIKRGEIYAEPYLEGIYDNLNKMNRELENYTYSEKKENLEKTKKIAKEFIEWSLYDYFRLYWSD